MFDECADHALGAGPTAIGRADRAHDVLERGHASQHTADTTLGDECELRVVRERKVERSEIVVEGKHRANRRDDLGARPRPRRPALNPDRKRPQRLLEKFDGSRGAVREPQGRSQRACAGTDLVGR